MKSAWPPARNAVGRTADINVEGHAVVGDLLDRSFLNRNRIFCSCSKNPSLNLAVSIKRLPWVLSSATNMALSRIFWFTSRCGRRWRSEKSGGIG